ncbi:hypothetical protein IGL98_003239 [Enterococcus sp. DIV0840]|uniref:tryglysin-associated MATE efflux transporter WgkD n=1 Tax=Enterococcus TaxID=1350 RepID=UPI001A903D67|nr:MULTISPECIES: MATE family efflux transporter [Enterococcus]MBO0434840.1 multidrug transporter [Enterococcus sp. DIV0849a]MBO0475263.1 multidrug transporter [Enterococcus ureasiticus]
MRKRIFIDINKFSLPLIFSQLITTTIGQKAFSIAARLGTDNLIAMNTIDNLIYSVTGVLGVISVAFSMLSSKSLGEKDTDKFKKLVSSVMHANAIIGSLFFFIILFFSKIFISAIYKFSDELLSVATTYLYSMSFYVLLTLITFTLTNLLKVEKKTNYILTISIISSLIQVLLSYIFINGIGNFSGLGVFGAGIALNITLLITILCYLIIVRTTFFSCLKLKPIYIKDILIRSIPLGIQELLEGIIFLIFFDAMIARLDTMSLSVYSIISQALVYLKLPMFMYGNAVTIFASEYFGEKNKNKIIVVKRISTYMSIFFYVLIGIGIYLMIVPFSNLFTFDDKLINETTKIILPLFFLVSPIILYEINKYILQVIENGKFVVKWTLIINIISMGIIFMLYLYKILDLYFIYAVYFGNYLILSALFEFKFKKVCIK